MGQAGRVEVADDDHGSAQQAGGGGGGEANRACAGNVDGAARADAGSDCAVVAGGQDVGEAGQVTDLLHGLVALGEFEQVEIGVGNQHVLGLATGPVAHVDITVGAAGTGRVDGQAHAGVHFLAGAAAAAGHVEGYRYQVADLQVFHVTAFLDHLTGDLVAEHQADLRGGTATHHVLVRAADVGGDHLQDYPVFDLLAPGVLHLRVVDLLHFDFARTEINDTTITRHA
ncbi:hypothetical protein D9M71_616030 [compost metagenome]